MDNYLLMKYSKEAEELSKKLGWKRTFFVDRDFIFIQTDSKKVLLGEIRKAGNKIIILEPKSEEILRLALEKSDVDIVVGLEKLHQKDSLHFVRSGLDQVLCKIATDNDKIIAFSLNDILHAKDRAKILARIAFNQKLCKKYKVKTIVCCFAKKKEEIISAISSFPR